MSWAKSAQQSGIAQPRWGDGGAAHLPGRSMTSELPGVWLPPLTLFSCPFSPQLQCGAG